MSRRSKLQVRQDTITAYEMRLQGYSFEDIAGVLNALYHYTAININLATIKGQVSKYEKEIQERPLGTLSEEVNYMVSHYQMLIKQAYKEIEKIEDKGTSQTRVVSDIKVKDGARKAIPKQQIDDINKSPNEKLQWYKYIKSCVDAICKIKGLISTAAQLNIIQQFNQQNIQEDGKGDGWFEVLPFEKQAALVELIQSEDDGDYTKILLGDS